MRKTRLTGFVVIFVLGISIIICTWLYGKIFDKHEILQSNNSSIGHIYVEENSHIHFFKYGFTISGTNTKFYTFDGKEMSLPFKPEDIAVVGNSPVVTKSTSRYILVNDKFVYDTSNVPFNLVYKIGEEYKGFDMREFDNMLLLILRTQDNKLTLLLLEKSNYYTINLEGMEQSHYLDASYDPITKGLSILALAIDTPSPSTRIFNFVNGNSPYGMLSLNDLMFYKLYRIEKNIVLVGINQLICYNVDGSIKWNINAPNCYIHQHVALKNGLLLYFPKARFNNYNTIWVSSDDKKELLEFPSGLINLQPYKNQQLIAINRNNDLVIMDRNGNIVMTYTLDIHPTKVYWTPFSPDYLYVLGRDNLLYIYTMNKSNDRKDENS